MLAGHEEARRPELFDQGGMRARLKHPVREGEQGHQRNGSNVESILALEGQGDQDRRQENREKCAKRRPVSNHRDETRSHQSSNHHQEQGCPLVRQPRDGEGGAQTPCNPKRDDGKAHDRQALQRLQWLVAEFTTEHEARQRRQNHGREPPGELAHGDLAQEQGDDAGDDDNVENVGRGRFAQRVVGERGRELSLDLITRLGCTAHRIGSPGKE